MKDLINTVKVKTLFNTVMYKSFGVGIAGFGFYLTILGVDMALTKPLKWQKF